MESQDPKYRKYLMVAQSFGTGGNNTLAGMFVIWMGWLSLIYSANKTAATRFSRIIHFAFANTHAGSLEKARAKVRSCQAKYPNISVSTQFDLMDAHIDPADLKSERLRGKGSPTIKDGEKAIDKFLPKVKELIAETYLYLPIATLGLGNTGSAAIVPVTRAANDDPECWVMPLILLSAKAELKTSEKINYQAKQRSALQALPVWAMFADNGYFAHPRDIWNQILPMQASYKRINFLAMSALRSFIMMLAYPTQIDQSKLENSIFAGPGGSLAIGAIDIDPSNELKQESKRAAQFLFDSPFLLEWYKEERDLGYDKKAKFDVAVLGIMGGVSAPIEQGIIEGIEEHHYLMDYLPDAEMHFHRFGSYLPADATTMFALLTRKRPGESIDLRYPPENHPDLIALRDLEIEAEDALDIFKLGRGNGDDRDRIPQPAENLIASKPALLDLISQEPEKVTEFVLGNGKLEFSGVNLESLLALMEFVVEHKLDKKIDFDVQKWLVDELRQHVQTKIPSQGLWNGVTFQDKDPIDKLDSLVRQTKSPKSPVINGDWIQVRNLKFFTFVRKICGDGAIDQFVTFTNKQVKPA